MSDFEIVQLQNPTIFQLVGGLNYRGEYDGGTEYAIGDVVYFEGSSYVSTAAANTGNAVTDTSKWQLIAQMGDTGAQGDTGATGSQGVKGDTGSAGSAGAKGDTGSAGATGSQGGAGATGAQGVKGDTGSAGATGAAGAKGDTGSQGTHGDTGVSDVPGDTGVQGDTGVKGDTGSTGSAGAVGATGATGGAGAVGATGAQGAKGDTGSTGSQGVKGDTGSTGSQGTQGNTGAAGSQGAKGDTGSQGVAGNTGVKGDTGNPGGVSFYQTFDSATTEADPGAGEFRLNHATLSSVTEIYIDDADAGATDIIDLVAAFDDASNPVKGFLEIRRSAAPTNWVLYRINSLTDETGYTQLNVAYVDHAGTITGLCEILFSRAGDKGDTGTQGTQGATGTQGVKGDTGTAGSNGAVGATGAKGDTGNTGSAGAKGDTGNTGSAGAAGATGVTGATGVASPTLSLADDTFSGITASLTAGTGVVLGNVCYVGSDGKMELADMDAIATASAIAIATGTIAENAAGAFGMWGFMRDDSAYALTPGGLIYLSGTPGGITQTAPSATDDVIQVLGVAMTADIWFFNPQLVQVEHT